MEPTNINLPEHKLVVEQTDQILFLPHHGTLKHQNPISCEYVFNLLDSDVSFIVNRFVFPYPLQWGPPKFFAGHIFAVMSAVIVSMVEVSLLIPSSFCY